MLLALLARSLDLDALAALFRRLPIWFYAVSLTVVLAGQVSYALRWRLLLSAAGVRAPVAAVVKQYFVGVFVNNFLPSTVGGDVVKVYYLGRDHGYRVVTASVVIDRVLGVGLLALLAFVALAMTPIAAPQLAAAQIAVGAIAVVTLGVLVVTGVGTGGLPERVARLGDRAVGLAAWLQRLRIDMAAPLARPSLVAGATLVVLGYAVAITLLYTRFVTLQGQAAPPALGLFAVVTATAVLSNVPISLNGLGVREQLHVSLLAPLAVSGEIAVAMSLLVYAHLLVVSLIGLVFWLRTPPVRYDLAQVS
jgi:uncharacterized protein (TIRG00374 family)